MKYFYLACFLGCAPFLNAQNIQIMDSILEQPVAFATISFGNGLGTFAGDDGVFRFENKKYEDVDSIFISAIGYKEVGLATKELAATIFLPQETSQLKEVILTIAKRGKFKKRSYEATTHTEYFDCWLPTVESEVAVRFDRYEGKSTKITKLLIPINAEKKYRKKGNLKFSTLFRVLFYNNELGVPGQPIPTKDIVFRVSEKNDEIYELDIIDKDIMIPEDGLFASIQVLGYADKEGKLIQTKKYNEVETRRGIRKISTTFRPLLPFTDALPGQQTFVRRIFFNDKKWQVFDSSYNPNSKLVESGHINYGMGAIVHVYQD